jgi:glucose-6-phosphate isomerase
MRSAQEIVVVGMGGSVLPLRALLETAPGVSKIRILDSVDPAIFDQVCASLANPLFCVVSKSGETLEIQVLLAEILNRFPEAKILAVTDPSRGALREQVRANGWLSLEIPPTIGGRFTHFTIFHRALAEMLGVDFDSLLVRAKHLRDEFKKEAKALEHLFRVLFDPVVKRHVLWAYGSNRLGMAEWMLQALGESLGKINAGAKRSGVMPMVLRGPQDQHSILQMLMDGPQDSVLWFIGPKKPLADDSTLQKSLWVLAESTLQSFCERVETADRSQSIVQSCIRDSLDATELIVLIQCFIEYAAIKLEINAFDQPGVERGKIIAREIWAKMSPSE